MICRSVLDVSVASILSSCCVHTAKPVLEARAPHAHALSICDGMSARTVRFRLIGPRSTLRSRARTRSEFSMMLAPAGGNGQSLRQPNEWDSNRRIWTLSQMPFRVPACIQLLAPAQAPHHCLAELRLLENHHASVPACRAELGVQRKARLERAKMREL